MASMEHPLFSLSTKPDHRIRRYEQGERFVEIKPAADGLATVHDRDVLIYCISQLMVAINNGQEVSQVVRFKAYDLLKATNRMTDTAGGAARVLAVFVTRVDRFLRGGWAYCIAGPRSARVFSRSLRRVDLLPFEKA